MMACVQRGVFRSLHPPYHKLPVILWIAQSTIGKLALPIDCINHRPVAFHPLLVRKGEYYSLCSIQYLMELRYINGILYLESLYRLYFDLLH